MTDEGPYRRIRSLKKELVRKHQAFKEKYEAHVREFDGKCDRSDVTEICDLEDEINRLNFLELNRYFLARLKGELDEWMASGLPSNIRDMSYSELRDSSRR